MSQGTSSKSGIGTILLVAVLVVAGVAIFSSKLPERMPPDPFEGDEQLYVVTFRVEWTRTEAEKAGQVPSRFQDIHYRVGQEEETYHDVLLSPWEYTTVGKAGQELVLDSIQSAEGLLKCYILVDEEVIAAEETIASAGCFLEEVV